MVTLASFSLAVPPTAIFAWNVSMPTCPWMGRRIAFSVVSPLGFGVCFSSSVFCPSCARSTTIGLLWEGLRVHSMLRWIWAGIRALGRAMRDLLAMLWNVLSSAITWVAAAIAYLVDTFQTWLNDAISGNLLPLLKEVGVNATEFPDLVPLASYYLGMFAADEASTCLLEFFTFWLLARAARLAVVPIRAILEIL